MLGPGLQDEWTNLLSNKSCSQKCGARFVLHCNIAQKFVSQQECELCRCDVNGIPCRHYKLCDTGVPVLTTLIPFLDLTTQLYISCWQLPTRVMDNRGTQGHVSLVSRMKLGVLKWRVVQLQCIACQYMIVITYVCSHGNRAGLCAWLNKNERYNVWVTVVLLRCTVYHQKDWYFLFGC